MSLLDNVTTGKNIGAQFNVIVGVNGVGKTTFAASFPGAIILDLEGGSKHLNVARVDADKIPDLPTLKTYLTELATKPHPYQAVGIDSAESLEFLISEAVCVEGKVDTIEKYDGGFGKGFARSREMLKDLIIHQIRPLLAKGITVNLTAHTQVKTQTDPAHNQTYDRVIMRCNDKFASVIRDLADNIFYATFKVHTTKENNKTLAYGDQRVMYTSWRAGYDAKNRLELPHELPLSYDAFVDACKSPSSSTELIEEIQKMSERCDDKLKKSVAEMVEKFKDNPAKLKDVKNRLMTNLSK